MTQKREQGRCANTSPLEKNANTFPKILYTLQLWNNLFFQIGIHFDWTKQIIGFKTSPISKVIVDRLRPVAHVAYLNVTCGQRSEPIWVPFWISHSFQCKSFIWTNKQPTLQQHTLLQQKGQNIVKHYIYTMQVLTESSKIFSLENVILHTKFKIFGTGSADHIMRMHSLRG